MKNSERYWFMDIRWSIKKRQNSLTVCTFIYKLITKILLRNSSTQYIPPTWQCFDKMDSTLIDVDMLIISSIRWHDWFIGYTFKAGYLFCLFFVEEISQNVHRVLFAQIKFLYFLHLHFDYKLDFCSHFIFTHNMGLLEGQLILFIKVAEIKDNSIVWTIYLQPL